MSHSFISYEKEVKRFKDVKLWILRHFLFEEAKATETTESTEDAVALREFFEKWRWMGPGLVVGANFSLFVSNKHSRRDLLFRILQRTADRIANCGEQIPVAQLSEIINTSRVLFTSPIPTERLLNHIRDVCEMLDQHKLE